MPPIEIQKLETAVIVLAKAIEQGRTQGVVEEIEYILGYLPRVNPN